MDFKANTRLGSWTFTKQSERVKEAMRLAYLLQACALGLEAGKREVNGNRNSEWPFPRAALRL